MKKRIWKLGNLEHNIIPSREAMEKFAELIKNNADDIVWGPDIELIEYNADNVSTLDEAINMLYCDKTK